MLYADGGADGVANAYWLLRGYLDFLCTTSSHAKRLGALVIAVINATAFPLDDIEAASNPSSPVTVLLQSPSEVGFHVCSLRGPDRRCPAKLILQHFVAEAGDETRQLGGAMLTLPSQASWFPISAATGGLVETSISGSFYRALTAWLSFNEPWHCPVALPRSLFLLADGLGACAKKASRVQECGRGLSPSPCRASLSDLPTSRLRRVSARTEVWRDWLSLGLAAAWLLRVPVTRRLCSSTCCRHSGRF